VRGEIAEKLGLQDGAYAKEIMDWQDVKDMIEYVLVYDVHVYHDERYRAQIIWILLLMSDAGERVGAIISSGCYRDLNIALRYEVGTSFHISSQTDQLVQDVELFMMPAAGSGAPKFELRVTYKNRKGERDNLKEK
jgi:hypothetical protein